MTLVIDAMALFVGQLVTGVILLPNFQFMQTAEEKH